MKYFIRALLIQIIIFSFIQWISYVRPLSKKDQNFHKLAERFNNWRTNTFNSFEEYYSLKAQDGPICRNNNDCKWIDENMKCYKNDNFDEVLNVSF